MMMLRKALVLSLACSLAACGDSRQAAPGAAGRGVKLSPRPSTPDSVLARVNGTPLLADDLRHQLQGGAGSDRRAALRALIQQELLAQEAARRGLDRDPAVQEARRKALTTLIIRRYREGFTKQKIPRDLLQRAYNQKRHIFVHPELRRVWHILVRAGRDADAGQHRRARRLAQSIHNKALARPLTTEQFKELARQSAAGDHGLKVHNEPLYTGRRGYTLHVFADAAFELTRPAQISKVVRTVHGYHVIYCMEVIPARNVPLSQVEDEIRDKIFEPARTVVFDRWVADLERKYKVQVDRQVLERALGKAPPPGR